MANYLAVSNAIALPNPVTLPLASDWRVQLDFVKTGTVSQVLKLGSDRWIGFFGGSFIYYNPSAGIDIRTGVTPVDGVRYFVDIVKTGTTVEFFIDSVSYGTDTQTADTSQDLNAISENINLYSLTIEVDGAIVRNYQPSATYDRTDPTLYDIGPNRNHGTLNNFTLPDAFVQYNAIEPTDFARKCRAEVTHVTGSELTGFVALLELPTEFSSVSLNAGQDVVVCASDDGLTRYPLEIVTAETSIGAGEYYVWMPTADYLDELWLLYGNAGFTQPTVDELYGRNQTWLHCDSRLHLNTLTDSSGSGDTYTLTASASIAAAYIGEGLSAPAGHGATLGASSLSYAAGDKLYFSAWVYRNANNSSSSFNENIYSSYQSGGTTDGFIVGFYQNKLVIYTVGGNTTGRSGASVPVGVWTHVAIEWDMAADTVKHYVNGAQDGATVTAYADNSAASPAAVGIGTTVNNSVGLGFNGLIDSLEFGVNRARDADYIAAEYAADTGMFFTLDAPQDTVGGGATYTLIIDAGSYAHAGIAVNLLANRDVTIDAGNYTCTSQNVNIYAGRALIIVSGSYSYTDNDASLIANRMLSIDASAYAYTGLNVDLTYTPASGATYTLTISAGNYDYAGENVQLAVNRSITIEQGDYAYTGEAVALAANRALGINAGDYSYTGNSISMLSHRALLIDAGLYEYAGYTVNLTYSGEVIALISGYSVNYKQDDIAARFANDDISSRFANDDISSRFN